MDNEVMNAAIAAAETWTDRMLVRLVLFAGYAPMPTLQIQNTMLTIEETQLLASMARDKLRADRMTWHA